MEPTSTFPRSAIRTMRKDLKKMREADVVKEKEKIVKAQASQPAAKQTTPPINLPIHGQDEAGPISIETEKQKAFLLQQQQEQLAAANKKLQQEKQALVPQKEALVKAKEKIEDSLKPLAAKEATASEDDQQVIEKQRWPIENELEKLKSKIEEVNERYEHYERQEQTVTQQAKEAQAGMAAAKDAAMKEELRQRQEKNMQKEAPAPVSENQKRKKFMEDIEAWANSNKQ